MSETEQEFQGVTEAEAAIKACEALNVGRSQLIYDVVSRGPSGITIAVTGTKPPEDTTANRLSGERSRGGGFRDGAREGNRREGSRDGFRDGNRGSGRRGGGDRGGRFASGRGGRGRDRDEDEMQDRLAEEYKEFREMTAAPKEPAPRREKLDEAIASQVANRALTTIRELMKLGGFEMEAQLSVDSQDGVEIDLHGSDEGLIIGRKGETLLALQFIVNRMLSRDSETAERVLIDCEGYRVRRQNALKTLAVKLGEKAKSENRTIAVTAMNAHDRRIFHVTLDGHEGLHTRSEGDGLYRKLLIIPEAAPSQRAST